MDLLHPDTSNTTTLSSKFDGHNTGHFTNDMDIGFGMYNNLFCFQSFVEYFSKKYL